MSEVKLTITHDRVTTARNIIELIRSVLPNGVTVKIESAVHGDTATIEARALRAIAPWLSASLSDPNIVCCKNYHDACALVFQADELNRLRGHNDETTNG